jgi:hypothetical protein|tara:strand:- start:135 stop:464 length:330 start_codon:yes stop_codon:yes gene_type:complete
MLSPSLRSRSAEKQNRHGREGDRPQRFDVWTKALRGMRPSSGLERRGMSRLPDCGVIIRRYTGNAQPNGAFQGNRKLQISNVPVSLRQALAPRFSIKFSWTGEVLQAIP